MQLFKNIFKAFALITSFFICSKVIAQDSSLKPDEENESLNSSIEHVLVSPLDPNLYMSDIDAEISTASNNISQKEIVDKINYWLDKNICDQLKTKFVVVSFLRTNNNEIKADYGRLYNAVKPVWQELTPAASKEKKLLPIQKGQVAAKESESIKFMNTTINDFKTVEAITKKYNAKYYVFINQLEIKNDVKDQYDYSTKNYLRLVNVHYNIIDATGKQIAGGIATSSFDANTNSIKDIISGNILPSISKEIADKILLIK